MMSKSLSSLSISFLSFSPQLALVLPELREQLVQVLCPLNGSRTVAAVKEDDSVSWNEEEGERMKETFLYGKKIALRSPGGGGVVVYYSGLLILGGDGEKVVGGDAAHPLTL